MNRETFLREVRHWEWWIFFGLAFFAVFGVGVLVGQFTVEQPYSPTAEYVSNLHNRADRLESDVVSCRKRLKDIADAIQSVEVETE
jgi:hypothetical protein